VKVTFLKKRNAACYLSCPKSQDRVLKIKEYEKGAPLNAKAEIFEKKISAS
jgi:hypothetical protein